MTTLCYVASPSYSGSTLLAFLLGTHPDIATVGELKGRLYANLGVPRHCSCGRDVANCAFWQEVRRRVQATGLDCELDDLETYFHAPSHPLVDRLLRARVRGPLFELAREGLIRGLPSAARERRRLLERNRVMVDAICEIQGGQLLLDASKDAVRLKFLLDSGLWDVRVLHLIRDGRGVANSYRKRDAYPIEQGARRWRTAHESYDFLLNAKEPRSVHRIRYEDLATRPEATLHAVIDFLGLPQAELARDFMAREHHLFGNPMRLRDANEIALDDSWRDTLGPDDLEVFDRVAGDLNREFGYA